MQQLQLARNLGGHSLARSTRIAAFSKTPPTLAIALVEAQNVATNTTRCFRIRCIIIARAYLGCGGSLARAKIQTRPGSKAISVQTETDNQPPSK